MEVKWIALVMVHVIVESANVIHFMKGRFASDVQYVLFSVYLKEGLLFRKPIC